MIVEQNLDFSKRLDIRYRADDPFSLSFTLMEGEVAYDTTGKSYEILLYTPGGVTRFALTPVGNTLPLSRETMKALVCDWALREDDETLLKGKWIGSKDLQERDVTTETTLTINRTEGNVTVTVTKTGGGSSINDSAASTESTYSSSKIEQLLAAISAGAGGITHNQSTAATQWTIVHNLGFRPSVTVSDSSGNQMFSNVVHVSLNEVHIFHTIAQAGQAYLT